MAKINKKEKQEVKKVYRVQHTCLYASVEIGNDKYMKCIYCLKILII